MSPLDYLRSRVIPLLILVVAIALVGLMLVVFGIAQLVSVGLCLLLLFAALAAGFWDYLSRRRFYTELEESLRATSKTYYISELLQRPPFYEGQLTYDTIETATKDMNDRIALYRLASEEYREYIESWIHEVKTPIAALKLALDNERDSAHTEYLSTEHLNAKSSREKNLNSENMRTVYLDSLEYDVERIETYVEQALYYARSTAVEQDYLIKPIMLDFLVKNAVKKQSRALIAAGITPEFENLDIRVYSDTKWLDFILTQIINNALKYHKPRTEDHEPRICFSAVRTDDSFEASTVCLNITDNGRGIPEEDISRIFDKGFTGHNGRLFARSTGIGLYLCKKLCEKMKLSITAESEVDVYTTISITFPLSKMYFLD